jgi:hypothetical protein
MLPGTTSEPFTLGGVKMKYITPSMTIGVASNAGRFEECGKGSTDSPVENRHASTSVATLPR